MRILKETNKTKEFYKVNQQKYLIVYLSIYKYITYINPLTLTVVSGEETTGSNHTTIETENREKKGGGGGGGEFTEGELGHRNWKDLE
jgi:hypothetical protein